VAYLGHEGVGGLDAGQQLVHKLLAVAPAGRVEGFHAKAGAAEDLDRKLAAGGG
jgi:hypothetical protein